MICPGCQHDNPLPAAVCFNCGKSLWMVTRGTVVAGRYEVLSVLGHGGMGVVYKAHDRVLDEPVALKVLRPEVASTPELAVRFYSEIKLARKIRHANVCAIHEYGEDGPLRYIVMEYVEGTNLRELIQKRGPLPADDACEVALQALYGLGAVHDLGIIHRDLKSANVMRDKRGVIRLMDFGLATVRRTDDSPDTLTLNLSGTPEYMSPEQVRGDRGDFQSDIYALGIIYFEILTGEVPFRGESLLATMLKQLNDPPPLEGPRAALLPAPIVPVLRKALAKDPRERYATARGMAAALRLVRGTTASPAVVELPPVREDWLSLLERDDDESKAARADVLLALARQLATGDVPAKCVAALTLGRMGPRANDAVPALIDALKDPHVHVAEAAGAALRRIGGTATVALRPDGTPPAAAGPPTPVPTPGPAESPALTDLIKMLHSEDAALRREAVVALGERRSVSRDAVPKLVVPSLVLALSDAHDDRLRVSAAEALGQIGASASVAIPALIVALKHADDQVSRAAASALVKIGLPAAPALIEAVTEDDKPVRAAAVLREIVTTPADRLDPSARSVGSPETVEP